MLPLRRGCVLVERGIRYDDVLSLMFQTLVLTCIPLTMAMPHLPSLIVPIKNVALSNSLTTLIVSILKLTLWRPIICPVACLPPYLASLPELLIILHTDRLRARTRECTRPCPGSQSSRCQARHDGRYSMTRNALVCCLVSSNFD